MPDHFFSSTHARPFHRPMPDHFIGPCPTISSAHARPFHRPMPDHFRDKSCRLGRCFSVCLASLRQLVRWSSRIHCGAPKLPPSHAIARVLSRQATVLGYYPIGVCLLRMPCNAVCSCPCHTCPVLLCMGAMHVILRKPCMQCVPAQCTCSCTCDPMGGARQEGRAATAAKAMTAEGQLIVVSLCTP